MARSGQSSVSPPVLLLELHLCTRECPAPTHRLSAAGTLPQDRIYRSTEVGHQHSCIVPWLWVFPSSLCPSPGPWALEQARHFLPVLPWRLCLVPKSLLAPCLLPILLSWTQHPAPDSYPHVEALTCSLSLRALCASQSLPQWPGPS